MNTTTKVKFESNGGSTKLKITTREDASEVITTKIKTSTQTEASVSAAQDAVSALYGTGLGFFVFVICNEVLAKEGMFHLALIMASFAGWEAYTLMRNGYKEKNAAALKVKQDADLTHRLAEQELDSYRLQNDKSKLTASTALTARQAELDRVYSEVTKSKYVITTQP